MMALRPIISITSPRIVDIAGGRSATGPTLPEHSGVGKFQKAMFSISTCSAWLVLEAEASLLLCAEFAGWTGLLLI
jgi:hypothetical protein